MSSPPNHIFRVVCEARLCLWQVALGSARNNGKTQFEQRKTRRFKVSASAVAGAVAMRFNLVN